MSAASEPLRRPLEPTMQLYQLLRKYAAAHLRGNRKRRGLEPTDLANEAFVRLIRSGRLRAEDRAQLLSQAAAIIRNLLVDQARRQQALKRGAGQRMLDLTDELIAGEGRSLDLVDLDAALVELAALDERQARVVELRYFGGVSIAEAAEVLGVSKRTVELDWAMARRWLKRRLERSGR